MKQSSSSLAKLALLLSVAIGTTSAYYAHNMQRTVTAKKAAITKLNSDLRELKQPADDARQFLTAEAEVAPLDATIATLLVKLMSERTANSVSVSSVTPAKDDSGNDARPLSATAEQVGSSTVKSSRYVVTGYYQDYFGFLNYLASIRTLPVAIVQLKVEGNSFQLGLRAYGK